MEIIREGSSVLTAYESVPIGFWSTSRVDLKALSQTGEIIEVASEPWFKDYDAIPGCRLSTFLPQFKLDNWAIFSAFEGGRRLGGVIVAHNDPHCDMLEGRSDLAVLFDVRVHPNARGQGIGRALFAAVEPWALDHGCAELRVETQDINVAACRFYQTMGFRVHQIVEGAYPDMPDESMILWTRSAVSKTA